MDGVREGDRVAFITQHRPDGERRIENGTRGEVDRVDTERQSVSIRTDGERSVTVEGEDLSSVRLSYAQHLYRQQGATVDRAVVVTGGWQTSQEGAYVQASRARNGTDWHVAREDLGTEGIDAERVSRLAGMMRASRGQVASLAFDAVKKDDTGEELERSTDRQLNRDRDLQREMGMSL